MFKIKKMAAMLCAMMLALTAVSADNIKPNGCKGPTLCNSFPIYYGCGWHFEVGLLLEQMRVSNTDICYSYRGGTSPPTLESPTRISEIHNLNFYLDPGLRLGVGKYFEHDDWMFNANFEWLSSRGSLNLDYSMEGGASLVPIAIPTWHGEGTNNYQLQLQQLKASLNIEYYLLDVYLSRGSYFSGHFTYEPLAGLKTAWINYNSRQKYQDSLQEGTDLKSNEALLKTTITTFWGIGPMIGMNGNYYVCSGWSVFSMTNFSVLIGESRIKERMGKVTIETQPLDYIIKDTIMVLCPTLRNIIGLQYDKDMFCDTQHYTVKFGFDARYYFNQYPIVEYEAVKVDFNTATPPVATSNLHVAPNVCENNSFGMLGFILDFGWDF